jgi:hypothetical protein
VKSVARQLKTSYGKITVVVIAVAAVAVIASAAWAAIPDASGTIHACADRDGRLRVIDTENGKTCKSSEKRLSWSAAAPPPPPPARQLPDAFVAIRGASFAVQPTGEFTKVMKLDLPAGNYVVTAKAQVASRGTALDDPVRVHCSLEQGSPANDFAALLLAPVGHPGEAKVMSLLVSKELAEAGSVHLTCSAAENEMGAQISEVVIRAVEVGTITTDIGFSPLP